MLKKCLKKQNLVKIKGFDEIYTSCTSLTQLEQEKTEKIWCNFSIANKFSYSRIKIN